MTVFNPRIEQVMNALVVRFHQAFKVFWPWTTGWTWHPYSQLMGPSLFRFPFEHFNILPPTRFFFVSKKVHRRCRLKTLAPKPTVHKAVLIFAEKSPYFYLILPAACSDTAVWKNNEGFNWRLLRIAWFWSFSLLKGGNSYAIWLPDYISGKYPKDLKQKLYKILFCIF